MKNIMIKVGMVALIALAVGCIALTFDSGLGHYEEVENLQIDFWDDKMRYEVEYENKWYTIGAKDATLVYDPVDTDWESLAVFRVSDSKFKVFRPEEMTLDGLYINVCYMPKEE